MPGSKSGDLGRERHYKGGNCWHNLTKLNVCNSLGPGGVQHGEQVEGFAGLISIVAEQQQGKHFTHLPKGVNHPRRRRSQELQSSQLHLSPSKKLWRTSSRKPHPDIGIPIKQRV